jgi:hypothetical protein
MPHQAPLKDMVVIEMRCIRCGRLADDLAKAAEDWLILAAQDKDGDVEDAVVFCQACGLEEFRPPEPVQKSGTK